MQNIFFLGMVSFFIDLSTHMVYPLVPLYLVYRFGTPTIWIGVIEGVSESAASLLKIISGYTTDRFKKKKWLAFSGYVPAAIYKIILLTAHSWVGIFVAKVVDRLGKGIRTSPRDVLISESTDKNKLGKSFGLHKALDMLGVASGILITFFVLYFMGDDIPGFRRIFWISLIPSVLGLCMFFFIKEKKEPRQVVAKIPFWKNVRKIDGQLKLYLLVVFLFTLGNSSNVFILLRAQSVGFETTSVILLYFLYSMTASLLAMPFGKLSDKIGRKKLLAPGYLAFTLCYLGFAFVTNQWALVAVFVLYGAYTAAISGVERAYVSEIAPPELKGTMLGLQSTVAGLALLPASIIAGVLWDTVNPAAPFILGATLSLIAALILIIFMKEKRAPLAEQL